MIVIHTERLVIRKFTTDDAGFVLELFNSPAWIKFIGNKNVSSIRDASNYIEKTYVTSYYKYGFGFYLVELKDDQIPIGICGLIKRDHLEDVDLGFGFLPQQTGKGYAFEAASACLNFAKNDMKLDRIIAVTSPENYDSQNLIKKLGMRFEKMISWPDSNKEIMLFSNSTSENL